ncbi:DUF3718 domain-containing protein [Thalassotalea sp. PP2-459]|uniref:DUF3718 domain-containing protein n=1 Tax=Thalassotalea sp. PP2-459 TaxID=1742724 RepID=UPI000945D057|nr:DUF3718 domain-containing protein [Thalassotalea sp. PP2-459]OKY27485.1 hypothetical protein BI291_09375 [Thalassotalea sp. PP2-459]
MNKTILTLSLLAVTASITPTSKAFANEDMAQRICEYVAANDKNRLRTYMRAQKIKVRSIFDNMKCNGDNLLIFAAKNNALAAGEFIIGKIPAKKVSANIDALSAHSAHLTAEAKERVK